MAAPSNKQIKSPKMVGNQSITPSYLQFKLFHFIYPHKETYIVIPKVESDNIACIVPHENPLLFWYCFGSHLWFSGDTPIDLNSERLQAPWRALAFREKALDSTPGACIVEHASGRGYHYSDRNACGESAASKKNRSLVFGGSIQIPTPRVNRSVGNSASFVSHWNGGPSGWDFSVPTEH